MTPTQIAIEQCANYQNGGICLGITILNNGSMCRMSPPGPCVLRNTGARCEYLEQCVLPMARQIEHPGYRKKFEEAAAFYRRTANVPSIKRRVCGCGRELEKGKRFCYMCKIEKRRVTWNKANSEKRDDRTTVV